MNKFNAQCAQQAADTLEVDASALINSLELQVRAGMEKISKDTSIMPRDDGFWTLEDMIAKQVLKDVKYPLDEDPEAVEEIRRLIWRMMRDRDNYTSKSAKIRFARQMRDEMSRANKSPRWQLIVDMLDKYGYFEGFDTYEVVYGRDPSMQKYPSGYIKNHGLTIAWNGVGTLRDGLSRIGIDHVWNKVSDASILLYWPETESLGKRRWQPIESALDDILNPATETHKKAMRDWWQWVDATNIKIRPLP
jgi:hypothetical protein